MKVDRAIQRIRAYASHRHWSKGQLARAAGMQDTVLRYFDDPCWNPTLETLRKLEAIIPEDFEPDAPRASRDASSAESART